MKHLEHFYNKNRQRYSLYELNNIEEIKECILNEFDYDSKLFDILKYNKTSDPFSQYIFEFLDSLSLDDAGDFLLKELDDYIIDGYIDDYYQTIVLTVNKNLRNNVAFLRILDIVNYEIKTILHTDKHIYTITVEKTYPKPIKEKLQVGYHICKNTEDKISILNKGLRLKNGGHNKTYNDKWQKLYFISEGTDNKEHIERIKESIKISREMFNVNKRNSPVIKFDIPVNSNIYKDTTMKPLDNCYYIYCSIPPTFIKETNL